MPKENNIKPPVRREELDAYTRILQGIALLCAVVLIIVSNNTKGFEMPPYVIPGIMGIAIGLSPKQIVDLIRDIIKSALGRK